MNNKIESVLFRVYRGDNSIDVRTCKCHAHYHIGRDIADFGAPMGFEASKGERNLKQWAKFLGKLAQKCGEGIFVTQTAERAAEFMLLEMAHFLIVAYVPRPTDGAPLRTSQSFPVNGIFFTRKTPHLIYDLETRTAKSYTKKQVVTEEDDDCPEPVHDKLLSTQVKEVLSDFHGDSGKIRIWKEARLPLDDTGTAKHFIRAYHQYDRFGSFFDWVELFNEHAKEGDTLYFPALILLMYCTQNGRRYCVVWKAKHPTEELRLWETHISARWMMEVLPDGSPKLDISPIENIKRCIKVHKHWTNRKGTQLPSQMMPNYVLDEAYERPDWVLNCLDKERWKIIRKSRGRRGR